MRRIEQAVLIGLVLSTFIVGLSGPAKGADQAAPSNAKTQKATKDAQAGPSDARQDRDPVTFSQPTFVDPPKKLLGDSGDGRCPDPSKVCFKDNNDILNGRRHLLRTDDLGIAYQIGTGTERGSLGSRLLTDTSNITTNTSGSLSSNDSVTNPIVIGARLFNTPNDVAVSAVLGDGLQWFLDGSGGTVARGALVPAFAGARLLAATADFTGDGYDDLIFFTAEDFSGGSGPTVVVATAVDPTIPSQGLKFGGWSNFADGQGNPLAITTGAVAGTLRVFSLAHTEDDPTLNCHFLNDLVIASYMVDPQSLAVTSNGAFQLTIPEGNAACGQFAAMATGRFGNSQYDQLAVAYAVQGGTVKVIPIDFDVQGNPVQRTLFDTGQSVGTGRAWLRSGQFDWSNPFDQAALLISSGQENSLRILTFDQNLNVLSGPVDTSIGQSPLCVGDVAVGNFDRMMTIKNPTPPPDTRTIRNPNLQLAAFLQLQCGGGNFAVQIFDVSSADPTKGTFQFGDSTVYSFSSQTAGSVLPETMAMAPVDLQGRSLRVGLPTKVTIDNRSQPMVALAAPPMHVDAVQPLTGGTQRPFNVSGVPAGFFAKFSLSNIDDYKSNTTDSTTWSWGSKETFGAKGEIGSCELGDCLDFGYQATAQQALDGSKATLTGNFSTFNDAFNFTTGFADKIYYKDETLTIYVYPVIGRTVCPSDTPNCTDSQKVPLVINMAGPDTQNSTTTDGSTLTWYQPPWIPGNILSYPGNEKQLAADAFNNPSDFQKLSDPIRWFTGDGSDNASATWTNGSSTGSTSSFNQNYSFDLDISVSGKLGVGGLDTLSANAGIDLSGSFGFSHLTDSSTTLSKTQGIEFDRTATFEDPNYGYYVSPYLFGQSQPGGVVDNKPLSTDVKTFGALRTGHVVDIPGSGCCGFWSSWYGRAPDVALSQPTHWAVKTLASDPGDGSCRIFNPGSSDFNCVQLSERLPNNLPTDIWTDEFHKMRGLFITGPQGQGPQLQTATTGDQLVLQARVYNLSMAPLPSGAKVHVRFMGMPWNAAVSPQQPRGASFLLGEQIIAGDQLSTFNSDTQHPNWTLVPQPFDTSGTGCGGQSCDNIDLVFWVAVWAEDSNGNLLSELPQHGLLSIPANGEDFLAVAGREATYSNNLGLYDQVFHIFPKTATVQAPSPSKGEIGVQLTGVGAASSKLGRGERTVVAAQVRTGSRDLNGGLKVAFYDGDPRAGGTLFGLQYLPHLRANSTYDFRVRFHSDACGKHSIYVVPGLGTRHEHKAKLKPIQVNGKNCKSNN